MFKLGLYVEGLCDEDIAVSGQFCARLRVVPHLSLGIEERAKRKRAWKSPTGEKATRGGEREKWK